MVVIWCYQLVCADAAVHCGDQQEIGIAAHCFMFCCHRSPSDLMREGHREELGDDEDIEEAEEEGPDAVEEGAHDAEDVVERVMNAHDGVKVGSQQVHQHTCARLHWFPVQHHMEDSSSTQPTKAIKMQV